MERTEQEYPGGSSLTRSSTAFLCSFSASSSGSSVGTIDLQRIVPVAPFFSYSGTSVTSPDCTGTSYIIYDLDSTLSISANSFQTITKICKPSTIKVTTNPGHYAYNSQGPALSSGDETYMECSPTGSSKEKTLVDQPQSHVHSFWKTGWIKNFIVDDVEPAIKVAVGVIIFLALLKLYDVVTSKITHSGGGGNSIGSLLGITFGKKKSSVNPSISAASKIPHAIAMHGSN